METIVDEISAWFANRFSQIEVLAEQLIGALRLDAQGRLELTESNRRQLKAIAVGYLAKNPTVDGCGLIFARTALGTENGHLEWWVREDDARFARYSFGVVPGGDRYYDYEHHEWFIRAFHEGTPALVGPYIDYLGVEAYVVTLTVPAVLDGVRVGAVGNDIQVADLEAALLPTLLKSHTELALLGSHGNVLIGNSSRFLPGEYVDSDIPGFARTNLGPSTIGLTLLYPSEVPARRS